MSATIPSQSNFFEEAYLNQNMPWAISQPQPAIQKLAESEKIIGDVLDLGCGLGENALMLTRRGHMVWGIDIAPSAISFARERAKENKQEITFVVGNALDMAVLGESFHTVLDSGLFHFLSDLDRLLYLAGLRNVMVSQSHLFLLCCTDDVAWGPRSVKRSDLRSLFTAPQGFKVETIEESHFQVKDGPINACLAEIRRL